MVERKNPIYDQIVFFDGICHLCNGFVDFAIQNETTKELIYFAPFQGETAQKLLSSNDRQKLETVIFYEKGSVYKESQAVFRILAKLQWPWKGLGFLGLILPRFFSDRMYRWVAGNRYQWFGIRDTCRIPLPEERNHLLP